MMIKEERRAMSSPQKHFNEYTNDVKVLNDCGTGKLDVIARRIFGVYADIRDYLSESSDTHDETQRRLYMTASTLLTLLNYLDEGAGVET